MKKHFLIALPLAATLTLPAVAQQTPSTTTPAQVQDVQSPADPKWQSTAQNNGQIQTGISANDDLGPRQPLQPQIHEGFWGKLNPFARKKYVQKQISPIRNRVNELDELTANNSKMLKDVDARATEGIRIASNKANEADQHALLAGQHAQSAQQTAQQASTRLQSVEQVVGNIDQYQASNQTEVIFRAGQTSLSKHSKETLDELVQTTGTQKGYIVQVQGFSPGRGQEAIQSSQAMAQAVARYLVIEHQIPVYRIFVVGMGNAPIQTAEGKTQHVRGGRVEVTILKNGVDQLQANAASGQAQAAPVQESAPAAAPWQRSGQPQPIDAH